MAGASMNDIKSRIKSVSGTMQITKAMELVATSKLRRARENIGKSRPFHEIIGEAIDGITSSESIQDLPWTAKSECKRPLYVVIAGDRGLAGGYNSNIVKLIANSDLPKEDLEIYAIGNKGLDAFTRKGFNVKYTDSELIESPSYSDAAALYREVLKDYTDGEIGEIYLAYTHFKNTVTHIPTLVKLLPVDTEGFEGTEVDDNLMMNFEPNTEEALDMIIPKYVTSLFYGALVESVASENGARMQAMDSATSNADEIISDLTLKFNRARQGAITQELTEIIAGANAIN